MWEYIEGLFAITTDVLTAWLCGALVASVVWIRITRRYARLSKIKFQEYESMLSEQMVNYESMLDQQFKALLEKEGLIKEKTDALRELYYLIHHTGPRPAMASGLGLVSLYWKESKQLGENLVLLSRPNHHRYAEIAGDVKARMDEYVQKIEAICKTLYQESIAPGKKFEHLQ